MRVILGAMILAQSALANAGEPLQPASRWQVDYDGTQCVAIRQFGAKPDTLHLVLKPYASGAGFDVSVIEQGAGEAFTAGTGTLATGGEPLPVPAYRFVDSQAGRSVSTFMATDLAMLADAETLSLAFGTDSRSVVLGKGADLVAALETCRTALQGDYDLAGTARSRDPKGEADVFRKLDYSSVATDPDVETRFRALLLIDEAGQILDCALLDASGDPAALAQACTIIREEARFDPAKGAGGKPMRASYVSDEIVWGFDKVASNRARKAEENRARGYDDAVRSGDDGRLLRPPGDSQAVNIPRSPQQRQD